MHYKYRIWSRWNYRPRLASVESSLLNLYLVRDKVVQSGANARTNLDQASGVIANTEALTQFKSGQVAAVVAGTQAAQMNATQALTAAQTAQTAVGGFAVRSHSFIPHFNNKTETTLFYSVKLLIIIVY